MNRTAKIVAALAPAALALTGIAAQAPADDCPAPIPVAHRGLSETAPENTLVALEAAALAGIPAVEVDVRFTRTDVPMLMHDSTVDRTTDGTGRIADKYVYQMRKLDAGSWFADTYAGEGVPTWWEALNMLRHYDVDVIVEIKGNITSSELDTFLNRIDSTGMEDRVVVTSFRKTQLAKVHTAAPGLALGFLDAEVDADPVAAAQSADADYYLPAHDGLTAGHVADLHDARIQVVPWTADTPALWESLSVIGVDGVITNRASVYDGWALGRCG